MCDCDAGDDLEVSELYIELDQLKAENEKLKAELARLKEIEVYYHRLRDL